MTSSFFSLSGPGRHRVRACCAALALGLLSPAAWSQSGNFGNVTPSVGDIITNLQGGGGNAVSGVRTRALRPGAASQATSVPPPAAAPAAAAPAPAAAQPARAPAISMQIQFEFGSDRIGQASLQTMDNLARALSSAELQGRQFTVVGHTDGVGSADFNQRLSQRRASSVKAYLVRHGVDAVRLRTEGRGFNELLDAANPRAAENRRVEVIAG